VVLFNFGCEAETMRVHMSRRRSGGSCSARRTAPSCAATATCRCTRPAS
jgi:hypothetical protein